MTLQAPLIPQISIAATWHFCQLQIKEQRCRVLDVIAGRQNIHYTHEAIMNTEARETDFIKIDLGRSEILISTTTGIASFHLNLFMAGQVLPHFNWSEKQTAESDQSFKYLGSELLPERSTFDFEASLKAYEERFPPPPELAFLLSSAVINPLPTLSLIDCTTDPYSLENLLWSQDQSISSITRSTDMGVSYEFHYAPSQVHGGRRPLCKISLQKRPKDPVTSYFTKWGNDKVTSLNGKEDNTDSTYLEFSWKDDSLSRSLLNIHNEEVRQLISDTIIDWNISNKTNDAITIQGSSLTNKETESWQLKLTNDRITMIEYSNSSNKAKPHSGELRLSYDNKKITGYTKSTWFTENSYNEQLKAQGYSEIVKEDGLSTYQHIEKKDI
ncbi:hypothetical protein [Pseudomonas sp. C5pp]|uniref:hypothetical protein n=1 Tax=Pseudomonas sp. C5pp TaxID=1586081 RepID=UPI000A53F47B|nr:hypothetical protein [Pseudomonas sp. C5pp]